MQVINFFRKTKKKFVQRLNDWEYQYKSCTKISEEWITKITAFLLAKLTQWIKEVN